jgi:protein SCO1/2
MPSPRLFSLRSAAPFFALVILPPLVLLPALAGSGCRAPAPAARTYELKGQILAIDQGRLELTVNHADIPGFMPAMTMPYKVRDANLLKGRKPGELIAATLVVEGSEGYLQSIRHEGLAALPDERPAVRAMNLLDVGEPVRDGELVDQNGARRSLGDWRGQVLAVTFVYTRCPLPNFCPLIDRHFADVQEQVQSSSDLRGRVHLVSVTLDPEYDTPAVLLRHAGQLKADPAVWSLLTGPREQVEKFASQFGVSITRESAQPSGIVHNLRTAVIDGNGRLATILSGGDWQPAALIAEIRNALGRS